MAFISRITLLDSTLLRLNKEVVFGNLNQKLTPPLTLGRLLSCFFQTYKSKALPEKNELKGYPDFKRKGIKRFSASKLSYINLSYAANNAENLPQGYLIAAFHKLCIKLHDYKSNPTVDKEMRVLAESDGFIKFCKAIEKMLPKLTPPNLTILLNLVHFNISVKSTLMRKIFTLILDNLHAFSINDLMEIYCELKKKKYENSKECDQILKACELYFDTVLEEELSHYQNLEEIIRFIREDKLPLKVRGAITRRILDEMDYNCNQISLYPKFFEYTLEEPIISTFKNDLLKQFKNILFDYEAPKVQGVFFRLYRRAVEINEAFYDEEVCEKVISTAKGSLSTAYSVAAMARVISEFGYFSRVLTDEIAGCMNLYSNSGIFSYNYLSDVTASFLRISYHEMNNPEWSQIKSTLENNMLVSDSPDIGLCEQWTFLGCNTTPLLEKIFNNANETGFYVNKELHRSILRLHHLSKKYFPDANLGLNKKSLNTYLQNSCYKKSLYHNTCVSQLFGSDDYMLYDCWTSDFHFLPIVAILDPDNNPINLSSYKTENLIINVEIKFRGINIDNIEKPSGSKVIVFMIYPDKQPIKFRNAPIISGHWRMFKRSYEDLNIHLVPLCPAYFRMSEELKLQYLKSEINKVIEKSETIEQSSRFA